MLLYFLQDTLYGRVPKSKETQRRWLMKLLLDSVKARNYRSNSQKARVLTEKWVSESIFCPSCGFPHISKQPNNKPVSDFFCPSCYEEFELKSKRDRFGTKIPDGDYFTKIKRLQSNNNPNLFILVYNSACLKVLHFVVIPRHFFVPQIIEKRKPLSTTAQRAGWIGSTILLNKVPSSGRIFLIKNGQMEPKEKVLTLWKNTLFLKKEKEFSAKGWLIDIMYILEKIGKKEFTLDEVYRYESELAKIHPGNKHIKEKIRQQLQILRNEGYLDFISRGYYRIK